MNLLGRRQRAAGRVLRGGVLWCSLVLLLLAVFPAFGDGKIFRSLAEEPGSVSMPDQQALIHFKDGVQTLAIETRFTGNPSSFAWVVPLPAAPEVSPAPRGLFKTLRAMHQPRIRGSYQSLEVLWVPITILLLVGLLRPGWVWRALGIGVACALLFVLFVPSLGSARKSAAGLDGVEVISRDLVGDFEVSVVQSSDPGALGAWLREHGFDVSSAAERVIADYVAEGWVFAAAKMRRDAAGKAQGPVTPHPLVFRFPTSEAVYPMRLTGVENEVPLRVDLYVLADARAEAPGFEVERCGKVAYESSYASHWFTPRPRGGDVRVSHEWMMEHVPGAGVATYLTGVLDSSRMTRDVRLAWSPMHAYERVLWTHEAALGRAVDIAGWVLMLGVLGVAIASTLKRWGRERCWKPLIGAAVAAGIVGGAVYAGTERAGRTVRAHRLLVYLLQGEVLEAHRGRVQQGGVVDEAWLRGIARELSQSIALEYEGDDAGMPIEEDSPGNYVIRHDGEDWLFVWYDAYGNEHAAPLYAK